jgi:hypothetical protein
LDVPLRVQLDFGHGCGRNGWSRERGGSGFREEICIVQSGEVLIVNLWEHQIGLYQGANMGLLKTVFEVNLGLFGGGGDGTKAKYVNYHGSRVKG